MSETDNSNASTANNQTVAVIPTGIASSERYISDMDAYVERVREEVLSLTAAHGPVSEIVVRGSNEIADAIDEASGDDGPDVSNYFLDFRLMLDDEENVYEGDYGTEQTRSVIEDGQPMVEYVAEIHDLTDEEIASFDLSNRDDRSMVNGDVLSLLEDEEEDGSSRIGRAKAKSKAKATDRVLNDYHDYPATADSVIVVQDGTDNADHAVRDLRGDNPWVLFPQSIDTFRPVILGGGESDPLNWTLALLDSDDGIEVEDLTEGQIEYLQATVDEADLEYLGLAEDAESEDDGAVETERDVAAEAAAVTQPAPTSAD